MALTPSERLKRWRAKNKPVTIQRAKLEELIARASRVPPSLPAERDAFIRYTDLCHEAQDRKLPAPPPGPAIFLGLTCSQWAGLDPGLPHVAIVDLAGMRDAVDRWRARLLQTKPAKAMPLR